ncbi:hypothetical protein MKW94_026389 [Papaver nudicaule]|uniref:Uncharacterized protein n=1 Tax=Papaver nudicaule TaxID=74823 RepID=A0AA41W309_PAPNU|nr:hypothetical protein [Papaver nudicaule]
MKWGLLLLSSTFYFVGLVGGPLLLRLYFLHGGNRKWLSSWSQMAGFPGLLVPLTILYYRRDHTLPNINFFASRKLLLCAALIGLAQGLQNFIRAGDRPPGVSNSQYLLGFFMTIASAAIVGFILVSTQVAYAKANQSMTYPIVLQFQFCLSLFATVFSTFGGLINKDFSAMHEEATGYKVGAKAYYLVLVSNMVVWQIMFVGRVGIRASTMVLYLGRLLCTSSLFAGVMTSTFLPITQVAAVLTFHESFPAEKGMALALTLWGFVSYLFGSYKNTNKQTKKPAHESKETAIQSND